MIKEAVQAMGKHHADMKVAYAAMSQQTSVQNNCARPIKDGINLFGNDLAQLELIRERLDGETKEIETALKKVADQKSAKRA